MIKLILILIPLLYVGGKLFDYFQEKNPVKMKTIHSSDPSSNEKQKIIQLEMYGKKQYQCLSFIDNKWVLHNLNGPAIFDEEGIIRPRFYINGVEYKTELQYLVEKENYKNGNINKNTI